MHGRASGLGTLIAWAVRRVSSLPCRGPGRPVCSVLARGGTLHRTTRWEGCPLPTWVDLFGQGRGSQRGGLVPRMAPGTGVVFFPPSCRFCISL